MEVAARLARQRAMERTGLCADQIGVIFSPLVRRRSPMPKTPLGTDSSAIDGAIAIKDIYPKLLFHMKEARKHPLSLSTAGQRGVGWGKGCRRILCPGHRPFSGCRRHRKISSRYFEELEDEKLRDLEFIELDACPGGCVGGTLQVENAYVAKSKFKRLNHFLPPSAPVQIRRAYSRRSHGTTRYSMNLCSALATTCVRASPWSTR